VAHKALDDFKARIRQLTRRSGGRSMGKWWTSSGPAQTPGVWRELDKWLRHRLRAIQLWHWRRPRVIYRELKASGAADAVAKRVAANSRRWWRNSDQLLKTVLTVAHFDRLGLPRLS
jgi:RNA-directed DNA polymerase